jgi:zinc D-Ala-D-Ala dipeptidase
VSVNLLQPIPNLDVAREIKANYREHPVDANQPFFDEPLVALSEYGVDGVSYYSQPNNATSVPVAGVSPNIFVRRTVAEKLASANAFLLSRDDLADVFGSRVELYVRDGFRSPALQKFLHDSLIPSLLRSQNPDWNETRIAERVKSVIAFPEFDATSMPPHFTGGAVDLSLRTYDTEEIIDTGRGKAELGRDAIHTDYLEKVLEGGLSIDGLERALNARRVLYNVMTSAKIGGIALANNPTEAWHFSLYDQMWAILGGHKAALYGLPTSLPGELMSETAGLQLQNR